MDWSKLTSRKLWVTVLAIILIAGADLLGIPMDEATLDSIMTMVLGMVGSQGLVDTAQVWKAGKLAASTKRAIDDLKEDEEPTDG